MKFTYKTAHILTSKDLIRDHWYVVIYINRKDIAHLYVGKRLKFARIARGETYFMNTTFYANEILYYMESE